MKKTPTVEQKAAVAERRAKFRALVARIAKMTDEEKIALTSGMLVTVEGHTLSFKNQLLVALQLPGASVVAGFRQWIRAGRCVKNGQHGAVIWIYTGSKETEAGCEPSDAEVENGGSMRFVTGTVFDISQTEEIGVEVAA